MTTVDELHEALAAPVTDIEVRGELTGMPMITLPPGVRLRGGTLRFGAKGLRLTSDNVLEGVTVLTAADEVAIGNDTAVTKLGSLVLRDVRTVGQVLILLQDEVRAAHVQVEGLTVSNADVRGRMERPRGFGVEALQGAFTLWNRQADSAVVATADLQDISVGTKQTPIRGSGVFVGGHGDVNGIPDGGTVRVSTLRTSEIHTHGGIPSGTPDLISGGVFVICGVLVDQLVNAGPVTTNGPNDMVLDNWGEVTTWTVTAPITSTGASGIGFVNFGRIGTLDVRAPIATFGRGARGFNLYDGELRHAGFDSITTHGDGSIGVQVSKPLPTLEISGDLTTAGDEGLSLVRGRQVPLKAIALSVMSGGRLDTIDIGGRVHTAGDNVVSVEIIGRVDRIAVAGGISAQGRGSDAVHTPPQRPDFSGIEITSAHGEKLVHISD